MLFLRENKNTLVYRNLQKYFQQTRIEFEILFFEGSSSNDIENNKNALITKFFLLEELYFA